jgi:crotonobetainyl-CoA:carnitine CoA-transferase CaiB-like acyl-CoA transferase
MDIGQGAIYEGEGPLIAAALRTRPLEEWIALLKAQEIPFAPVLTPEQALHSEHAAATGLMHQVPAPARPVNIVGTPIRIDGARAPLGAAPGLGEHNGEILRELGLGDIAEQS